MGTDGGFGDAAGTPVPEGRGVVGMEGGVCPAAELSGGGEGECVKGLDVRAEEGAKERVLCVVWELFAFLPRSSLSASRGADAVIVAAVLLGRVVPGRMDVDVVVGRGDGVEGREGREGTSSCVRLRRRLWATLILVSSSGGGICSTSISAGVAGKAGAEARSEEGAGCCRVPFDKVRDLLEAGGAGWDWRGGNEEELLEENGR
jgi:hypothetical protein